MEQIGHAQYGDCVRGWRLCPMQLIAPPPDLFEGGTVSCDTGYRTPVLKYDILNGM